MSESLTFDAVLVLGGLEYVKDAALCEYGRYMSIVSEAGLTPLLCAAQHGDAATVRALLEAGADLHLEMATPFDHLLAI